MIRYVLEENGRLILASARTSKEVLEKRIEFLITYYSTQETYGIASCEKERLKNLRRVEGARVVKVKIERV